MCSTHSGQRVEAARRTFWSERFTLCHAYTTTRGARFYYAFRHYQVFSDQSESACSRYGGAILRSLSPASNIEGLAFEWRRFYVPNPYAATRTATFVFHILQDFVETFTWFRAALIAGAKMTRQRQRHHSWYASFGALRSIWGSVKWGRATTVSAASLAIFRDAVSWLTSLLVQPHVE